MHAGFTHLWVFLRVIKLYVHVIFLPSLSQSSPCINRNNCSQPPLDALPLELNIFHPLRTIPLILAVTLTYPQPPVYSYKWHFIWRGLWMGRDKRLIVQSEGSSAAWDWVFRARCRGLSKARHIRSLIGGILPIVLKGSWSSGPGSGIEPFTSAWIPHLPSPPLAVVRSVIVSKEVCHHSFQKDQNASESLDKGLLNGLDLGRFLHLGNSNLHRYLQA